MLFTHLALHSFISCLDVCLKKLYVLVPLPNFQIKQINRDSTLEETISEFAFLIDI